MQPYGIAVASRDKTIMLYSLVDEYKFAKLEGHKFPVRKLSYSLLQGALLSVGSENYINIWNPNATVVRALTGKLFGH